MPSLATTRGRDQRDKDIKNPGPAATRRAKAALATSMVAKGPGTFGTFASTGFAADMLRARWDVDFFCERFLGFTPHPGQSRLFRAYIMRDESRWMARFLTIAIGGREPGWQDPRPRRRDPSRDASSRWARSRPTRSTSGPSSDGLSLSYEWYHFGVHSEVAELVFYEITPLLSGHHEAQKHGCPLTQTLGEGVADWSQKYRGEYLMISLHPLLGGGVIHFRTTGERAIGSLGKDMHGVSFDECAFEPNFDFVIDEVLHMRRLSTGGQLFLIGTMTEGLTAFADKWQEGNPEAPDKKVDSYSVRISPARTSASASTAGCSTGSWPGCRRISSPRTSTASPSSHGRRSSGHRAVDAMFDKDLPEPIPRPPGAIATSKEWTRR